MSGKVLPGTAPPGASRLLGPSWQLGVAGIPSAPLPPRLAPTHDGLGAAPRARRGQSRNSTERFGRRAAVAPPLRAPLTPTWARSESACLSGPPSRLTPSALVLLPGCLAQPRIPPSRCSSQFPYRRRRQQPRWRRGGTSRQPPRFSRWSGCPAWLPSVLPCHVSGRPAPPTQASFSSKWEGRLVGSRCPSTWILGLALPRARRSPGLLPRQP